MSDELKCITLLVCFLLFSFSSVAQGARSLGLSSANVCLEDEAAVFNNIAGATRIKDISSISSYNNRFGLSSLNTLEAGILFPFKIGVLAADVSRYGNQIYNESRAGLGFSHRLGNVSLGLKGSYQQLYIEDYVTKGILIVELGVIAEIIPNVSFGAHIFNVNQAAYSKENQQLAPVVMKAGIGYNPTGKLQLLGQVEKNVKYRTQGKFGIEYSIIPKVFLRVGVSTNPVNNSFGMGLLLKKVKMDYALCSYQRLGFQHSLSLIAVFPKLK